ncbi:hypothetical protein ETAA8_24370 [Anatilimnocola aggregata]|uniref:Uncharacterized protein n=1 Tax=Anatilimnocola aggregata TaxID=2528021 RepID=A0A517YAT4_9BACT|nr:hypothetical protein [Anatilimnocola aggregata]QDU27350.1 hypothetical protein ETAA8_24370 [Anatilimnocola aggregata]
MDDFPVIVEVIPKPDLGISSRMSYVQWFVEVVGTPTLLLLFVATIVALGLIVLLRFRGRGSAASTAVLLLMTLPLLVGTFAFLAATSISLRIVAVAGETSDAMAWFAYGATTAMLSANCFLPILLFGSYVLLSMGMRGDPLKRASAPIVTVLK